MISQTAQKWQHWSWDNCLWLIQQTLTQNSETINLFPLGGETDGRRAYFFENVLIYNKVQKPIYFKRKEFKQEHNIFVYRSKPPLAGALPKSAFEAFHQDYIIHECPEDHCCCFCFMFLLQLLSPCHAHTTMEDYLVKPLCIYSLYFSVVSHLIVWLFCTVVCNHVLVVYGMISATWFLQGVLSFLTDITNKQLRFYVASSMRFNQVHSTNVLWKSQETHFFCFSPFSNSYLLKKDREEV